MIGTLKLEESKNFSHVLFYLNINLLWFMKKKILEILKKVKWENETNWFLMIHADDFVGDVDSTVESDCCGS